MTSKEAREHEICRLSKELYLSIIDLPYSAMPDGWFAQVTDAILSMGSNWAEGIGRRGTPKAPAAFYRHARGSGYEASWQLWAADLTGPLELCDKICDLMDGELAYFSLETGSLEE